MTTNTANALSIIYDGFKCTDESAILGDQAQSIFTIEEDLGGGNYRLLLENGYLVFKDKICIELINTSIDPANLHGLSKIKAVAYFNGNALVISYGLIKQNKDIVNGNPILLTDINFPSTYTLVFDYLPSTQRFKLKSATKLDNLFTALHSGSNSTPSFSSSHVDPILPVEEIQFLIKE
ncbi:MULTISPECIES: hypothetical protein [Nitrosomonas]|uniref:Uncharacterized protein n=1 Tax=Nitrosomonas communis TaxID=44574 RepID=A0A0F7KCP8_9PROT|nr:MULTISPECIES: hypothetical protein [Nitrosomonas]AKH37351.1 hypothetical protein AAW31_05285 [Nitrosomonas communis]TYP78315.1 hypothetical protein BCL69_107721 [Nitrosomonas communis]UVS62573.1 hypothetical protein NX761_05480 [Nitrosomonas sp. PLL12]